MEQRPSKHGFHCGDRRYSLSPGVMPGCPTSAEHTFAALLSVREVLANVEVLAESRLSIYSDSPSPVAARPGTLFTCATTHRILVDNQIRPTTSGTPVNDTARISRFRMDRSKLGCAPSRPAVLAQERCKVCPCFAFMPSVPQGPGPAAARLEVGGRGRVDDHPDGMS